MQQLMLGLLMFQYTCAFKKKGETKTKICKISGIAKYTFGIFDILPFKQFSQ